MNLWISRIHELTKDNYYDTLINMYDYAMQYDYETIFH